MTRLTRFTSTLAGDATDTSGPDARDTLNDILARSRGTTVGMKRLCGMGATFTSGGGNNNIAMFLGKESFDAEVVAIRPIFFSKEPDNPSSGWEFIAGATDQLLNDSTDNAFVPQVGGTKYNFIVDAMTGTQKGLIANANGFRRAQFGGANTDGRVSKSGTLRPGSMERSQHQILPTGGFYPASPSMVFGDWMDIKTYPAADGRFYIVWRAKKAAVDGETNAFGTFIVNGVTLSDANPLHKQAAALPWYRRQFQMEHNADAISDLTLLPNAPTEANYGYTPYPIAFEVRFAVPVRTVMACGDSLTEGGGYQSYGLNNWLIQACQTISTAANPVLPVNFGFSTTKFNNFIQQLEQAIAQGIRPTDVVLPDISFNDLNNYPGATSSKYLSAQLQGRLLRAIEICRRIGARVYVYTDWHGKGGAGTSVTDQLIDDLDKLTRKLDAAGAIKMVDWRGGFDVPTMQGPDATHPLQNGIDVMTALLVTALTS